MSEHLPVKRKRKREREKEREREIKKKQKKREWHVDDRTLEPNPNAKKTHFSKRPNFLSSPNPREGPKGHTSQMIKLGPKLDLQGAMLEDASSESGGLSCGGTVLEFRGGSLLKGAAMRTTARLN